MVTSENGNLHTYMRCIYVHLQSCTYISDVSKRGVLGSADDDIAFFCILWHFLLIMGRSIIFRWFFVILTMCFIIFHFFLFQLYARTENYIATLVERHGFQEKTRVPREKSGRHSNLIYLVLKPLKKSGTAFGDLSVFWRCFSLLFNVFLFWRWVSLIFHYFEDVAHYCSMIFHYFQHVFHYFSLIFQCC